MWERTSMLKDNNSNTFVANDGWIWARIFNSFESGKGVL